MRIISEQKDYYDCVQAMGQDQSLVYVRKEKVVDYTWPKGYPFPVFLSHHYQTKNYVEIGNFTVGFCGKIYPAIELSKWVGEERKSKFCYSVEDVDEFVTEHFKKKQIEAYHYAGKQYVRKPAWLYSLKRTAFVKFWESIEQRHASRFEDNYCPVFVGEHRKNINQVTCNGCLRNVEFYRIFDPYRAFQEIAMYLGSIAVPLKPIPEVSDKDTQNRNWDCAVW